jgi:ankyrin repeat protein
MEVLLAAHCNVNLQSKDGRTPLLCATHQGHVTSMVQLIAMHCDVNIQDSQGFMPIHIVVHQGHTGHGPLLAEKLIEARCNVNLQMRDGDTPLHVAVALGKAEFTRQLIAARCDVAAKNGHCFKPLHVANIHGHAPIAKDLISARCDVIVKWENGNAPISLAARNGHATVVEQLISGRCDVDVALNIVVFVTVFQTPTILKLKESGSEGRYRYAAAVSMEKDGFTLLHIEDRQEREPITRLLFAARCSVVIQDKVGRTALQVEQLQGHSGIIMLIGMFLDFQRRRSHNTDQYVW